MYRQVVCKSWGGERAEGWIDPDLHELYALLRDLDTKKIEEVWVDLDLPDSWHLYISRIKAAANA